MPSNNKQSVKKLSVKNEVHKSTLSANKYIAAMAAICVLVILLGGYLTFVLAKGFILQTKVTAAKVRANNDLDIKIKNAESLTAEYHNLGETTKLIDHALPTRPDFPQLISVMEGIAAAGKVRLVSISPSSTSSAPAPAASGAPSLAPYGFNTEVTGNYESIVSFLRNVELSARPIRVVSSEFSGTTGSLRASLQLETYFQAPADISDKTEEIK